MIDKDLKNFVIKILRRGSYRWPARNEALKAARVTRGVYRCGHCLGEFKKQQVHLDHIIPVVDIEKGFTSFDDYVHRLYCPASNFQVLCEVCHEAKTTTESYLRAEFKKQAKVNKKVARKRK